MSPSSRPSSSIAGRWARLWDSWATRSLAVGAVATAIDVAVLLAVIHGLGWPNPAASAVGVTVGSTFTFFANRHYAFRDHHPQLAPQAIKFALSTLVAMALHAWLVWLVADRWGVPVVLAKFAADLLVFTGGQLLVLRFLVFPKAKDAGPEAAGASGEVLELPPGPERAVSGAGG